jgi:hypothetical protein
MLSSPRHDQIVSGCGSNSPGKEGENLFSKKKNFLYSTKQCTFTSYLNDANVRCKEKPVHDRDLEIIGHGCKR